MKRSFSNLIMKFAGVLGDIIWYGFLGWLSLFLLMQYIFPLTAWIWAYLKGFPFKFNFHILFFDNLNITSRIIANLAFYIGYALIVIFVYNLRLLLKNISQKNFFISENYRYCRVMGFAIIFSGFSFLIMNFMLEGMEYFIKHDLPLGAKIVFYFQLTIYLVPGIILLYLAEVFRKGALMHNEHQLTV